MDKLNTPTSNISPAVAAARRRLLGHGGLVLLLGGAAGFGFLFFLLGEIKLWPFPGSIDYQLPGSYKAWRMSHLEGIINGFALWLTAAALPILTLSDKAVSRIANGLIIVAWTFVLASLMDAVFPNSRGLYFGGPITNTIAFLTFYVGVLIFMFVAAYIAWKALTEKPGT